MTVAIIAGFCVVLLVLAFLAPRLSRPVERAGRAPLAAGSRAGSRGPGPVGRLLSAPFRHSLRWVTRSGAAGRRGRSRLPF